MIGMHWFHVELGALLRAKRWLGSRREVDAELATSFAAAHAGDEHALRWTDRLASVARPPSGRLSQLALEAASSRASLPAAELKRWLGQLRDP